MLCSEPIQRKPQRGAAEGRPPLWRRPKAASFVGVGFCVFCAVGQHICVVWPSLDTTALPYLYISAENISLLAENISPLAENIPLLAENISLLAENISPHV